jgi:hypothetical protein
VNVSLSIQNGRFPIEQVDYFLNGTYLGSSKDSAPTFSFIPNELQDLKTQNQLRVIVYDTVGNKSESTVSLSLSI